MMFSNDGGQKLVVLGRVNYIKEKLEAIRSINERKLVKHILLMYTKIIGTIVSYMGDSISKINYKATYQLAIVAIAKNEAEYIREWVAFHKIIGASIIYLYDNESNDGMIDEIKDFVKSGFVIVNKIVGKNRQYDAYNDALSSYGSICKYMAFIDCDEFLMPANKGVNIVSILDRILKNDKNAGGVAVNWVMYGSSGFKNKQEGMLTERFTWRAKTDGGRGNKCIKSIVIPGCVKKYSHPHYPHYKLGYYNVNSTGIPMSGAYNDIEKYVNLRINHYFTKSQEEWIKRRALGMADRNLCRNLEEFYLHDNNDVEDLHAIQYYDDLKRVMKK